VAVFHRGQTVVSLPPAVTHILGDRKELSAFTHTFKQFDPQIVIDLIAYTEQDALAAVQTFLAVARRLIVLSSMDVYRAYDRLRGLDSTPADPMPLQEHSPLRQTLYPYRAQAESPDNLLYHYEKILVERVCMAEPNLPATILRLPCVYGPGDYQHRMFEYLKRMDDGRPAILLGDLRSRWRWTRGFVDNAAAAIARAATDERAVGQIYNVGEPEALTELEWVQSIVRAAGWPGKVVVMPEVHLPEHLRNHMDFRHHLVGDTSKLRHDLDYQEPVGFMEGIQQTVEWQRMHPPQKFDALFFDYAAEDRALANFY
jgi:nucleoside-diphosphate-sugar epimerase